MLSKMEVHLLVLTLAHWLCTFKKPNVMKMVMEIKTEDVYLEGSYKII